jgi:polar amino acid transport system substrate-binding protein
MTRLFLALVAALLAASPCARASAKDWSAIRIATEGAYPPFNYVENNELQGFEIEIAKAICEKVHATCTFVITDWDDLVPDLKRGQVDAVVASLEITEERRQKIALTRRYYRTPPVFMVRKDSDLKGVTPADMKGRKIGAMTGTVYATYLEDLYAPGAEVGLYANQDEASLDLALGRIDAVLGDKIALTEWLKRGQEASCCQFLADAPQDVTYFGEGYGIGLRKADADLKRLLDGAIEAIQADGTYERIRARYFPFDVK